VFELLNQTKTAMGARLLKQRLLRPLRNGGMIAARQECVQMLLQDAGMLEGLREAPENLLRFPDLDKLGEAGAGVLWCCMFMLYVVCCMLYVVCCVLCVVCCMLYVCTFLSCSDPALLITPAALPTAHTVHTAHTASKLPPPPSIHPHTHSHTQGSN
jgi:hypothetical protein